MWISNALVCLALTLEIIHRPAACLRYDIVTMDAPVLAILLPTSKIMPVGIYHSPHFSGLQADIPTYPPCQIVNIQPAFKRRLR
jgi:hypothetical protein